MTRTQIQLPDDLYRRAKSFAAARELSLAEVTRRGLELFLDRFPEKEPSSAEWKIPTFDGGGMLVSLEELREISREEEANRSLPRS